MEWVDGEIWGNVWQTECIARIDPATGAILGWIMLQVAALQSHIEALVTAVSLVGCCHDNRTFHELVQCVFGAMTAAWISDAGAWQKGARGAPTAQAGCPEWWDLHPKAHSNQAAAEHSVLPPHTH